MGVPKQALIKNFENNIYNINHDEQRLFVSWKHFFFTVFNENSSSFFFCFVLFCTAWKRKYNQPSNDNRNNPDFPHTVFISDLAPHADQEKIKSTLRKYTKDDIKVNLARHKDSGDNKPFGFVFLKTEEDVQNVLKIKQESLPSFYNEQTRLSFSFTEITKTT